MKNKVYFFLLFMCVSMHATDGIVSKKANLRSVKKNTPLSSSSQSQPLTHTTASLQKMKQSDVDKAIYKIGVPLLNEIFGRARIEDVENLRKAIIQISKNPAYIKNPSLIFQDPLIKNNPIIEDILNSNIVETIEDRIEAMEITFHGGMSGFQATSYPLIWNFLSSFVIGIGQFEIGEKVLFSIDPFAQGWSSIKSGWSGVKNWFWPDIKSQSFKSAEYSKTSKELKADQSKADDSKLRENPNAESEPSNPKKVNSENGDAFDSMSDNPENASVSSSTTVSSIQGQDLSNATGSNADVNKVKDLDKELGKSDVQATIDQIGEQGAKGFVEGEE